MLILPESGELALTRQPRSVDKVEIGPRGRVRVLMGDNVKRAPGGVFVFLPSVGVKGEVSWECRALKVDYAFVLKACQGVN